MNLHLPGTPNWKDRALTAERRNAELEQREAKMLRVLGEARDAIQALNRVLPDTEAVTR